MIRAKWQVNQWLDRKYVDGDEERMNVKRKMTVAVVLGIIGFVFGGVFTFLNPTGNTSSEISAVEKRLQQITDEIGKPLKGYPRARLVAPSMDEVSEAVKQLTWENQRIGMAKVMMKIEFDMSSERLPWNAPSWEDRYKYGNKHWLVQEWYQLIGKCIWVGLLSFAVVCVSSLLLLFLLSWTWYFLLERIKEISAAIKGN